MLRSGGEEAEFSTAPRDAAPPRLASFEVVLLANPSEVGAEDIPKVWRRLTEKALMGKTSPTNLKQLLFLFSFVTDVGPNDVPGSPDPLFCIMVGVVLLPRMFLRSTSGPNHYVWRYAITRS